MHLAAGSDRQYSLCGALHRIQDVANARDRACPPVSRTLFGSAETRNDLIVLARPKSDGAPAEVEERGPNATSTYIDCENQVPRLKGHDSDAHCKLV